MPAHDTHPLNERRFIWQFTSVEKAARVDKHPRIVERTASDAHTRTARLLEHLLRRLRCGHVTIADDRNVAHSGDDLLDTTQIDRATKTLLTRPAVDKDGCDPGALQRAPQVGGRDVVLIPAK